MDKYMKTIALWQSYNISSSADLDKYLDSFRVLFAYNSGKMENDEITYHDTREIFENGKVSGFTGNPRSSFTTRISAIIILPCKLMMSPKKSHRSWIFSATKQKRRGEKLWTGSENVVNF